MFVYLSTCIRVRRPPKVLWQWTAKKLPVLFWVTLPWEKDNIQLLLKTVCVALRQKGNISALIGLGWGPRLFPFPMPCHMRVVPWLLIAFFGGGPGYKWPWLRKERITLVNFWAVFSGRWKKMHCLLVRYFLNLKGGNFSRTSVGLTSVWDP